MRFFKWEIKILKIKNIPNVPERCPGSILLERNLEEHQTAFFVLNNAHTTTRARVDSLEKQELKFGGAIELMDKDLKELEKTVRAMIQDKAKVQNKEINEVINKKSKV